MSGKTVFTSHFNMHCFSCDSPIKKGEQITRCIETNNSNPKNLRNHHNNARWVHIYCVPKDVDTEFYREMIVDLMDYYQDMDENEAEFLVEEHDYWVHQEGAEFHKIVDESLEIIKKTKPIQKTIFEKAKSGNSKCVICETLIEKNEPRVAKYDEKYKKYAHFKHQKCWDDEDPIYPSIGYAT